MMRIDCWNENGRPECKVDIVISLSCPGLFCQYNQSFDTNVC